MHSPVKAKPINILDTAVDENYFASEQRSVVKAEITSDSFKSFTVNNNKSNARQIDNVIIRNLVKFLGYKTTRRLSNLCHSLGLGQFFTGEKLYKTLAANEAIVTSKNKPLLVDNKPMTVGDLAHKFCPRMYTINKERLVGKDLAPVDMAYEMLAPDENNFYSLIYYIKSRDENYPISIVDRLYDLIRPVLWGSKNDWEAIMVDVDRDTGDIMQLHYESSDYSEKPNSYYAKNPKSIHLPTKVYRSINGHWFKRTNYPTYTCNYLADLYPLDAQSRPQMVYVAWNGSFDTLKHVEDKGYHKDSSQQKLWPLPALSPRNLDHKTYSCEGFDLRTSWLNKRKNID